MTGQFPPEWKLACLDLLRAHKESLRRSLGFSRLGWDVIRNRIMQPFDTVNGDGIYREDTRLVRQNLEGWDKGGNLTDTKFRFVDLYVRDLAVTHQDAAALALLRTFRFQRSAAALSGMYLRKTQDQALTKIVQQSLPWTFFSSRLIGSQFYALFLRAERIHEGVISLTVGYLRSAAATFQEVDPNEIMFFEGFILPLETGHETYNRAAGAESLEIKSIEIKCALKLVSAEYKGLTGRGFADGELTIVVSLPEGDAVFGVLEAPSSVEAPFVAKAWQGKGIISARNDQEGNVPSLMYIGEDATSIEEFDSDYIDMSTIALRRIPGWNDAVTNIIETSYKGYLD